MRTMTQNENNRERAQWVRDRGSRRFDRAIHARRRLNAPPVNAEAKADRNGPNPRYAYLTQSHD
jgi:hypothetical protein